MQCLGGCFHFSAALLNEIAPMSANTHIPVTNRVPAELPSTGTLTLAPQTMQYNRLTREASAVPKKIAAGQHRVKSTGYYLLNESMQYAVSVQLA